MSGPSLRETFVRDGYVTNVAVLNDHEVVRARAWVDELQARRGGVLAAQETNLHFDEPAAWELATHPRVLDAVSKLLGETDIFLLSTTMFTKYPESVSGPKRVGWHQDLLHWSAPVCSALPCHAVLCCTALRRCYAALYCTALHCASLRCAVLRCAVLRCAALRCAL
jgi:hypothetical protein